MSENRDCCRTNRTACWPTGCRREAEGSRRRCVQRSKLKTSHGTSLTPPQYNQLSKADVPSGGSLRLHPKISPVLTSVLILKSKKNFTSSAKDECTREQLSQQRK